MQQKIDGLLVPKLRFPEFRDDGEWEMKQLEELVDIIDGDRGTNYPKSEDFFSSGYCVFLNAKNVTKNGFIFDEMQFVSKIKDESLRNGKLKRLDLVLTTRGSVGNFAIYSDDLPYENIRINSGMVILRIKSKSIYSDFLYIYCKSEAVSKTIESVSFGSAQPQLTVSGIKKFILRYPKPPEQKKIADCLSSISDRITLEAQKLDTLKAHKKGLMQQLFPAEGETLPKLRFPEFQDSGEWEEKRLEQISDIKTGPFGSVLHESDYVEIGTPIITIEHLDELGIKGNNFPKVSDSDRSRLSSYQLKKGDIVFSRVGSVDRCSIICINEDGWLFSSRLLRLRTRKLEENSPQFLNQLLKYEPSKTKIRNSAVGQTMPSLNTKILNGISLHLPLFVEQQKIADCLSSLDELIAAQAQAIDTLKTHKKGLMQQLFPSVEEVKG